MNEISMNVITVDRSGNSLSFRSCLILGAAAVILLPVISSRGHTMDLELIRIVDGSQNPNPPDHITFMNIQFTDGVGMFPAVSNPILPGDNVYAADFLRVDTGPQPAWNVYYGGWQVESQGREDRIYLRTSDDLEPAGPWTPPAVIIDNGVYEHVNDPSVVIDGSNQFHMLYTSFGNPGGGAAHDWLNYSSSTDGVNWSPSAGTTSTEINVSDPTNIVPGTIEQLARPSLVKDGATWKLWMDVKSDDGGTEHIFSYLAESTSDLPTNFEIVHRYASQSSFAGFFEPDVALRPDGTFLAVFQRHFNELFLATSTDGVNFKLEKDAVMDADHPLHPTGFISNPGLLYDQVTDTNYGVAFGMPTDSGLDDNQIGFAYTQYPIYITSPGQVLHSIAGSTVMTEQRVLTSGFTSFDMAVITDPLTGEILHLQDFSGANPGDVWELLIVSPAIRVPEPLSLTLFVVIAGLIVCSRRHS
jgi:hypothetical protein